MNEIKKKYIDAFFGSLSDEAKRNCHFEQYMWYAYADGWVASLEGAEALKAFEKVKKNGVYIIFQHNDDVVEKEKINFKEIVDNVENREIWGCDCYVVDKEFNWSFVYTHETVVDKNGNPIEPNGYDNKYYIGPFFAKINKS